ncbi:hypothetical protein QUA35_26005 [Microcoleus sp. N9_B2]|uniref:hypothetical protein n=1 Tax=unclassified Microcoleus TaxID=2642155 RepID=UPI002FD16505
MTVQDSIYLISGEAKRRESTGHDIIQPETISIELQNSIDLLVTPEQFEALALANPDLRLERNV